MPHPCAVCGRSRMNPNNRVDDYIFFGFPVNDEPRCKKWLEFCCREELYKLTKKQLLQRMVCSKHFLTTDFATDFYDRLNSTAVPSIYDPKQSLYNISCVLCGRFRKNPPGPENDGATFHHFPGEEFRCLKWLDFVGVDSYYRLTRREIMFCYICSKHFEKSQFMPGFHNRLIDTAEPNIKNPDEIKEDFSNLETSIEIIEVELFNSCDKSDKVICSLPSNVLEGQACAACGRLRTDPMNKAQKYKFHPFPSYEIGRCLKWCQFLEREDILRMSPNQIRKLVLCSGHFQTGQNFNNGNGPCDAVPTIWDCKHQTEVDVPKDVTETGGEGNKIIRASVSSKKPKMDPKSKPTPLAKKRGKSKRPTLINIPKIDPKIEKYNLKKLPIPTANNWKLITNQFQPITISNNLISNVSTDIKKVILPFSGDISNVAPIPVDSLSSMPPGLLIKIDLPGQDKNLKKPATKRTRKKPITKQEQVVNTIQHVQSFNFSEVIPSEIDQGQIHEEEIFVEKLVEVDEETTIIDNEVYYERLEEEPEEMIEEMQTKLRMSARCRRTLIPIQCELRRFLNKLKPYVRRLPKRSKAQVKLAIVNTVIDRL